MAESRELEMCLDLVTDHMWRLSMMENWSQIAYGIGDNDWHHEVCKEIDKLKAGLSGDLIDE